jgi:hypothetical protein
VTSTESDVDKVLGFLDDQAQKPLREQESRSNSLFGPSMQSMESRSPQRYRQEVSRYIQKCRVVLPEAIDEAAAAVIDPVVLRLINRTGTPLASVQVVLQIHGDVRALENEEGDQLGFDYFEGALPEFHRYGALPNFGLSPAAMAGLRPVHAGPPIRIDNSQPVTIHLPPVELRPMQHVDLEPFVLVAREAVVGDISVEWTATATNMDGLVNGQLTLNCDESRSFLDLLAADLRPERDR